LTVQSQLPGMLCAASSARTLHSRDFGASSGAIARKQHNVEPACSKFLMGKKKKKKEITMRHNAGQQKITGAPLQKV